MPVLTGTSGWQYRHWRDAFYPRDVPQRQWLEYYAGKFGPVLLQLPPTLAADAALLDDCLARFPADVQVAVEPRHPSWWTDAIREVLAAHDAALCWADRRGQPVTPLWRTAGWGYMRFHEGSAEPWPRYGERALASWAELIARTWPPDAPVYAYFNNDQNAAAVADAATLAQLSATRFGAL